MERPLVNILWNGQVEVKHKICTVLVRNTNIAFIGLHCDMCLNWGNTYVWGCLVWPFMENAIPCSWYFLGIFIVWSVNFSSLISKLWILYGNFERCGQFLNITGYFALSYIGKFISTGRHFWATFCRPINCWISLNYKAYFRHV